MSTRPEPMMPESKADRTRKSNEEIVNFLEHGDARGARWLETHPDARERAEQYRARRTHVSEPVEASKGASSHT
ncbi:MAG TPA: hypothetical protein VK662_08690 [Acidothermaceae bacterium]|nr:hypothetical protein [Acidothermaceae bacterium]